MKKIFVFARFTLILVLWTTVYAQVLKLLFMFKWNFNPLELEHWTYVYKQWQQGWVIKETSEVLFLALLFAVLPLWFLGLFLLNRIKFVKKKADKAPIETQEAAKPTAQGYKRPPAIVKKTKAPPRSFEQMAHHNNVEKTKPQTPPPVAIMIGEEEAAPQALKPAAAPKPLVTSNNAALQKPTPPKPDWDSLAKTLQDYASQKAFVTFAEMQVGSYTIDLVLLASNMIYLINLTPDGEEWVADESSFSEEPPVWFSEYDFNVSPAFKVKQAKERLEELLPLIMPDDYQVEVKALVALGFGTILNSQTMIATWEDIGVKVASFASGNADGIASIDTYIPNVSSKPALTEEVLNLMSLSLVSTIPDDDEEDDDE